MKILKTELKDCLLIHPDIYEDDRGFFLETFQNKKFKKLTNTNYKFVQDNQSFSYKNVLRGMHYQKNKPQGKLVHVSHGEIYDVVIDLRDNSPTYNLWQGFHLSSTNNKQLWVPPGFAHGFLVISDYAVFNYKCTDYYDPSDEHSIHWNDPFLDINWPTDNPIVSKKDSEAPYL
jgi:dTDP-4-dehydrorhamnose 3,5-epimerase